MKTQESISVRCVVAAIDPDGEPDLYFVTVKCSRADFEADRHLAYARQSAKRNGFAPKLAFDEHMPSGRAMLPLFAWESAPAVTVF